MFLLAQSLGLTRFLQLMTRFTVPEELLGSISVQGMKQDNYYRITTNRMPEAQIVVLDEPFKASSAILNVILSLINERVFDNGGRRIDVPMISLYGASNELPQGTELSALWDRFTVRLTVDYVSKAAFPRLIQMAADRPSSGMLRLARNNKAHAIALPPPKVVLQSADLFALITTAAHMPIPQDVRDAVSKLYAQQQRGAVPQYRSPACLEYAMISIRMCKKRVFSSWHAGCISCSLMMRVRIV